MTYVSTALNLGAQQQNISLFLFICLYCMSPYSFHILHILKNKEIKMIKEILQ